MNAVENTSQTQSAPRGGRVRVALRAALWVMALFAMGSGATRAEASCGDYLYRHGRQISGHAMSVAESSTVAVSVLEFAVLPDRGKLPVCRCSGPSCSSSPLPLVPVPAAPVRLVRGVDPALFDEVSVTHDSNEDRSVVPQSERGAIFEPASVFRPPA